MQTTLSGKDHAAPKDKARKHRLFPQTGLAFTATVNLFVGMAGEQRCVPSKSWPLEQTGPDRVVKDDSHRPHENPTCCARLEYNDTRVANDADGRNIEKYAPAEEKPNKDGSSQRCEGQDNAA